MLMMMLRRFCDLRVVCLRWSQSFDTSDNSGDSGGSGVNCGIFAGFWGRFCGILDPSFTPLGKYADQHDVDAIIDELIISSGTEADPQFYVDPDADFWAVAASHAL